MIFIKNISIYNLSYVHFYDLFNSLLIIFKKTTNQSYSEIFQPNPLAAVSFNASLYCNNEQNERMRNQKYESLIIKVTLVYIRIRYLKKTMDT
jgi:hypothetical protein